MKVEYYGLNQGEKERSPSNTNSKIEFKGQLFVPNNIARYSFEDGFFRDSIGKVYLRTGEVLTFKCDKDSFLSVFGKRR